LPLARAPAHDPLAMKNLFLTFVATVSLFAFAGCASSSKAAGPNGACCNMCPVSKEPLKADCPTAEYNGTKVGFCCEKCQTKWTGMSDADKKAAFDACCAAK
jgi:hypothetical protein